MLITHATVPPVSTAIPAVNNPSAATNTTTAPNPDDMGGDLAATIALLANTLATQRTPPNPLVLVTSPTKLWDPNTFNGLDANKL